MAESVNSEKLHRELKKAELPVVGVSSSGRVDYSRSLTAAEHETANAVIATHDPTVTDTHVFIEQLAAVGVSRDDVLYALWKSMAEGDNLGKDKLIETIKLYK
jgi:hypothetical protein